VLSQSIVKFLTFDSEETSQSITETTTETTKEKDSTDPIGPVETGLVQTLTGGDIHRLLSDVFPTMFLIEDLAGIAECNAGKFLLSMSDYPGLTEYETEDYRFTFDQIDMEQVLCKVYPGAKGEDTDGMTDTEYNAAIAELDEQIRPRTSGSYSVAGGRVNAYGMHVIDVDVNETSLTLSDRLIKKWWDVMEVMIRFPDPPMSKHREHAIKYLFTLLEAKTITADMESDEVLAIVKRELITPPKKEREPNPWYDAVATVFDLHGGRNGLMVGLLRNRSTKKGYREYTLLTPLDNPDDILKFGRWWKANHDGLTMVQSPAKVQSEVMGWQAKGCPDAPGRMKPKPAFEGLPAVVPEGGYVI
jgi:hypothetical protein